MLIIIKIRIFYENYYASSSFSQWMVEYLKLVRKYYFIVQINLPGSFQLPLMINSQPAVKRTSMKKPCRPYMYSLSHSARFELPCWVREA
jgi:hypothetical protein